MNSTETLSVGEVAASFGWTPRFVERLAVSGKIPGAEVQGQWRFRREDLIDWLDRKIQTLDASEVAGLEHRLENELQAAERRTGVAARLRPEFVALDRQLGSKAEVLKDLVALIEHCDRVSLG